MQDHFEELTEISRADIVGAPEREIQINVDPFKMQAAKLSFNDISNAISYENRDISGGLIEVGEMKRTIRVKGQFNSALDMRNIVVKNLQAAPIYLRDVAEIIDTADRRLANLMTNCLAPGAAGGVRPAIGVALDPAARAFLFGPDGASLRSFTLVALSVRDRRGVLALGSRTARRLPADTNAAGLLRIGELLSAAATRFL